MKTTRSKRMILESGRRRIYEIDLIELQRDEAERYLVNYRYGWLGQTLSEGTRTPDPITREAAERVFDSLVLSRRTQGYRDSSGDAEWLQAAPQASKPSAVVDGVEDRRSARLMQLAERLSAFSDSAAARLVWRIGQVRLSAALGALARFARDADQIAARVAPYALLRCAQGAATEAKADAISALQALAEVEDEVTAQQARIALSLLSTSAAEADRLRSALPDDFESALAEPDSGVGAARIAARLEALCDAAEVRAVKSAESVLEQDALIQLYLLSIHDPAARPLLLDVLSIAPFRLGVFRVLRRLFKAAEAADDAEVFALLAQRFDLESPAARYSYGRMFAASVRRYLSREQAFAGAEQHAAWTDKSRAYFRRRVWRHLRRMGALGDPHYVEIASACLLLADEAADPAKEVERWVWTRGYDGGMRSFHYPAMSKRYAIHKIMHGAGARLRCSGGDGMVWSFIDRPSDVLAPVQK